MPRKDLQSRAEYSREYYLRTKESRRAQRRKLNREFARRKRAADPKQAAMIRREFTLRRMGLNGAEFKRLLVAQKHKCGCCGDLFSIDNPPHVDHDHACCPKNSACSKCVRSLLCRTCNLGLGYFQDSIERLLCAIGYLARFK